MLPYEKLCRGQLKLGIIAGGQLGKMLIQEASKWAIETHVLDPDPDCPAKRIATYHHLGNMRDFDDVYRFGKQVDLLTYEMEDINIAALEKLQQEGVCVLPEPRVLALIQNKAEQKRFYQKHAIATAPFRVYDDERELLSDIQAGNVSFPFVQKLQTGGYDGKGVQVVRHRDDSLLKGACIIESCVAIEKEIAVIVARNAQGQIACFPAVEMHFDPRTNLVEMLFSPAKIDADKEAEAQNIASTIIQKLDMVGLLAVEFFIDNQGRILVNEMAPRPHNSGHHTIEATHTSQLGQLLRAILNLPLGDTSLVKPAVMINLLGEAGKEGAVHYKGLREVLANKGVHIHLYGKSHTRPFRKMGHITVLADTLDEAFEQAQRVKNRVKVTT